MTLFQKRRDRLETLRKQRPQFADIFSFYSALNDFFAREQADFFTIHLDKDNNAVHQREGLPLLAAESLTFAAAPSAAFLCRLAAILAAGGRQGQAELQAIAAALERGHLDANSLFRACLGRDRVPFVEATQGEGLDAALLEYLVSTALGFVLQTARANGLSVDSAHWQQGSCPLCGDLPLMGELTGEEGRRTLHCATCGTSWSYPRIKCCFCGNSDAQSLEYFTAGGEEGYRVDICRKCCCYLKTVDSRILGENLPMTVEDLNTLHLDVMAQKEGFTRGKKEKGPESPREAAG